MPARRLLISTLAIFAALTAPASAAPVFDPGPPRYVATYISAGLNCPSERLCIVGDAYVSTDPAAARSFRFRGYMARNVECASDRLCLGSRSSSSIYYDNLVASARPARGTRSFHRVGRIRGSVNYFSCPSTGFCGVLAEHSAFSRHPARKRSWVTRRMPGNGFIQQFTCSAGELCMAWQDPSDGIATIQRPTEAGSRWRIRHLGALTEPGEYYVSGACVGPSTCMITTSGGGLLVSQHVEQGRRSWTRSDVFNGPIGALKCFSPALCVGLGGPGRRLRFVSSTSPLAGTRWSSVAIPVRKREDISRMSCPSPTRCFMTSYKRISEYVSRVYVRAADVAIP